MIKVIHLEGKFILVDDEYVLSVQASIISTKDEDGYIPNEFFEFVKILDEDEFEIDEVGLSFNPLYPNKESFSTNIFILENPSQIKQIKKLQLLDKVINIRDVNTNERNIFLSNKLEEKSLNSSSKWVPHLAAKVFSKPNESVVSIKASLCPQPDEDQYVSDEYFEFIKLLDDEGFQLEEVGISFNNTKPLKITNSTAKIELYDSALLNKIKYIQLFDSILCINPSLEKNNDLKNKYIQNQNFNTHKESETFSQSNFKSKGSCKECHAEIPLGIDICDDCRSEKLKKIRGIAPQKTYETIKKPINFCEKCRSEIKKKKKICDACRSQQLKNILR